jgi:hypothetical protein
LKNYWGCKLLGDFALPKVLIILGIAMLVAGLAAVVLGVPYIVLERGFTQVIVGTSVAASGLVLAVLGMVLREVRGLRLMMAGLRANTAIDDTLAAGHALDHIVQPVENNGKLPTVAMAGAGAAVLAGGLVAAGMAKADSAVEGRNSEPGPVLEPLLPDSAPDILTSKIDHAVDDLTALRRDLLLERDADGQEDNLEQEDNLGAERSGLGSGFGTEIAGTAPLPLDYADEFSAMLDKPTKTKLAEVDAATDSDDDADDVLPGTEADAQEGEGEADGDKAGDDNNAPPMANGIDEDASSNDAASDGTDDADTGEAQSSVGPSQASTLPGISDEGIIGVHTVGASTFTMYADGTIRAETPDGPRQFENVAALKLYLAQDKTSQPLM